MQSPTFMRYWDAVKNREGFLDRSDYGEGSWVAGTPFIGRSKTEPSPIFRTSTSLQSLGRSELHAAHRFAATLVTNCALRVDPTCEQLGAGPIEQALSRAEPAGVETGETADGTGKVYDLLKEAALFDFRGDLEHVFRPYERFLEDHVRRWLPAFQDRVDRSGLSWPVRALSSLTEARATVSASTRD